MKIYKVKYTLNENLCWSRIDARSPQEAAEKVYRQISEAYPDDEYEYMDVESDFDDSGVHADDSFIEDGNEYTFIERVGGVVHLDFDNWAVWSARNEDTGEINFFIVDEDTGFIDWGPVDTEQEATEFLQSKISDWENNDDNIDDIEPEFSIFEDLENYTSDDSLAAPIQEGVQAGLASVINSLIVDEYEAIDGYTSAIATARAEGYEDVVKVLEDISAEESVHVGQLQEVMKLFDPGAVKVAEGVAEAAEQLDNPDDEI